MIYRFYEMRGRRLLYQTDCETELVAWGHFSKFMSLAGAVLKRERVGVEKCEDVHDQTG